MADVMPFLRNGIPGTKRACRSGCGAVANTRRCLARVIPTTSKQKVLIAARRESWLWNGPHLQITGAIELAHASC